MPRKKPIFARRRARPSGAHPRIVAVPIRRLTGFESKHSRRQVQILRDRDFVVDETPIIGDAPKDFLYIYQHAVARVRRADHRTWPRYIAKVGHQYYPAESITEQVMTRVGQLCGVDMAESMLMECGGQLRFLSRYFLAGDEILNHGADILGGYLSDREFIKDVSKEKAEKEVITFQDFCAAIRASFPETADELLQGFVRMIGFDALVGNQDRHFYNWGVITHPRGVTVPRFAPIFDTARGLFWNTTEDGLAKYKQANSLAAYAERSTPEIGWEGEGRNLNHFGLLERIAMVDGTCGDWLRGLGETAGNALGDCQGMVDAEFQGLLSPVRRDCIKQCLALRFERYVAVLR